MKYIILMSDTLKVLQRAVNSMINEGYIPQGGITIDNTNSFIQAMIKIDIERI